VKNYLAIVTACLFFSLSGAAQSQIHPGGVPSIAPAMRSCGTPVRALPTCGSTNPQATGPCPTVNSSIRPTNTATSVPVRYVNVPVPNFNRGNGYGYGYGYGPGGFGYGYGYGGYNYGFSGSAAPINAGGARPQTGQSRPAAKKETFQANPQTARNYQYRKALDAYARENSVGGKLFLNSPTGHWLLEYDGQPEFEANMAYIPCTARNPKGFEEKVTLTLEFDGNRVVRSALRKNR